MSDQLRDQVQDPHAHPDISTARNLPDAADAEQSLEGYASVNGLSDQSEVARVAYRLYQERQREGHEGSADGDWFRAEQEVLRGREATNM
jgi:hypothetical protein